MLTNGAMLTDAQYQKMLQLERTVTELEEENPLSEEDVLKDVFVSMNPDGDVKPSEKQ